MIRFRHLRLLIGTMALSLVILVGACLHRADSAPTCKGTTPREAAQEGEN